MSINFGNFLKIYKIFCFISIFCFKILAKKQAHFILRQNPPKFATLCKEKNKKMFLKFPLQKLAKFLIKQNFMRLQSTFCPQQGQ